MVIIVCLFFPRYSYACSPRSTCLSYSHFRYLQFDLFARFSFSAQPPILTSIADTACSPSGNALFGCPSAGGGTLTINGFYFYGAVTTISVNVGCALPLTLTVNAAFTQITCTLAAGAGNSGNIVVTTNGGSSTATNRYVNWGNAVLPSLSRFFCRITFASCIFVKPEFHLVVCFSFCCHCRVHCSFRPFCEWHCPYWLYP